MSLKQWADNGWLRPHVSSSQEIAGLVDFVKELRQEVRDWLNKNHAELLPDKRP